MANFQDTALAAGAWLLPLEPRPPAWVAAIGEQGRTATEPRTHAAIAGVTAVSHGSRLHVSTMIPDADRLEASSLEEAVTAAYLAIAQVIGREGRHAVRFWNFIPSIHAAMGDERDRYMVFNAGRFKAFTAWYGPRDAFSRALPTASAVGIREGALVIHAVAGDAPGQPIENPRQVPAYSYSERYGPLPPCFARATLLDADPATGERRLLVGGTASILGEDSIHRDVRAQTTETFENLSRLLAAARAKAASDGEAEGKPSPAGASEAGAAKGAASAASDASGASGASLPLAAFTTLRVYIVRREDADIVRDMVATNVAPSTSVEFAQADLCRQELLVEIEGVARL